MYNNPEIIEASDIQAITSMSYTPGASGEPPLLAITFALTGDRPYADPPTRFLWPSMPAQLLSPVSLESLIPPAPEVPAEATTSPVEGVAAPAEATTSPATVPESPLDTPLAAETAPAASAPVSTGNGGNGKGSKAAAVPLSTPTEGSGGQG